MFKFNFSVDDSDEIVSTPSFNDPTEKVPSKDTLRPAKQHFLPLVCFFFGLIIIIDHS